MSTFDERTEKNIATLHPKAQELARKFMATAMPAMKEHGLVIKIICGNRTYAEQDALYAQGRTAPGNVVTNARGGYSNHCFQVAFDIGLFRNGAYLGDDPHYAACGKIGQSVGLEWGGSWKFCDEPHFQYPHGLSMAELRARVASGQSVL